MVQVQVLYRKTKWLYFTKEKKTFDRIIIHIYTKVAAVEKKCLKLLKLLKRLCISVVFCTFFIWQNLLSIFSDRKKRQVCSQQKHYLFYCRFALKKSKVPFFKTGYCSLSLIRSMWTTLVVAWHLTNKTCMSYCTLRL